jgi:hypothetical protein
MACFKPLEAWRSTSGQVVFYPSPGVRPMLLKCGQCIGCRLDKSREWALRCVHEASLYEKNCFITLTYNPENLPPDAGLRKIHFQKYMKRLRKRIAPGKVRFFHCGEYGEKNNRPHYHAILFGYNYPDWNYLFDSEAGFPVYTSELLEKDWQNQGFVTVGEVTFGSAAYVARYVLKKVNGKAKDQVDERTGLKPYERFNEFTGEIVEVAPEYTTMSRCPGIGSDWISKYTLDVYPKDYTTVNGVRQKPPRFYDEYLKQIDPILMEVIKGNREQKAIKSEDNTPDRLRQREEVKKAQNSMLKRTI